MIMEAVLSWMGSPSGVSLIVSLIALCGVIATTWWNNNAADKRRKEDQDVADQRRRDDQAAEDRRRKADDDRRDQERLEQLQREDWTRQRLAVAHCIKELTRAASTVTEQATTVHLSENPSAEQAKLVKAVALSKFFVDATAQMTLLDLEITQHHVSEQIGKLWDVLVQDAKKLNDSRIQGDQTWISTALTMDPLSDEALHQIRKLTIIARLSLLEYPEHMAKQPLLSEVRDDGKQTNTNDGQGAATDLPD